MRVALVALCGGFRVALGWLCTPKYMPSIWLCGGFRVALDGSNRGQTPIRKAVKVFEDFARISTWESLKGIELMTGGVATIWSLGQRFRMGAR